MEARLSVATKARRLVFTAVAAGLVLGALNLLALAGEWVAYGAISVGGRPQGLYVAGPGRPQLRPGAHLDGWLYRVHIGPMGFREPNPDLSRADSPLRVWCLGGSTTFDIYAPDDSATWPARLPEALEADLGPVEVVNAGIPGEVLLGNLDDVAAWAPKVRPRYVVVYQGPNVLRSVLTSPADGKPPPWRRLVGDTALVRLADRLRPQLAPATLQASKRRLTTTQAASLRAALQQASSTIRKLGARPVFVTHALRAPPGATGEALRRAVAESAGLLNLSPAATLEAFTTWNKLVVEVARQEGLPLADVRAAVGPEPENWGDATHFAPAGSARAARVIAAAIVADAKAAPRR